MNKRQAGPRSILAVWFCLSVPLAACFSGDFVLGLPCQSDEECGPQLSCVGGFCGGLGYTPTCGNSLLEQGEECDDGNTDDDDECTPLCQLPVCGDGFLGPNEECDDGNTALGDDCTPACLAPVCGDGFLGPGEDCDDGNTDDDDACSTRCTIPTCGNGIVETGEECDDGDDDDTDACTSTCHVFRCGDGLVGPGEECDDGNDDDADACTSICRPPFCGDGIHQEADEECDDGNEVDVDACTTECTKSPDTAPTLELSLSQVKQFDFSWEPVLGAAYYRLLESADIDEDFVQVGEDIVGESFVLTVPLHFRMNARYKLAACNSLGGCRESTVVAVAGSLVDAIGYYKASNTGLEDEFGASVALSADGSTLAVGAPREASSATGIDGDGINDDLPNSGAVYVFVRDEGNWSQQAYIKASNTGEDDQFGVDIALSADGSTLVVGAPYEDSSATGIDGDDTNDLEYGSGAAYVFIRNEDSWSQQAYVKPSNTEFCGRFGISVAVSHDGDTVVVGAYGEHSNATGVYGNAWNDDAVSSGSTYVFVRDEDFWSQQAYIKASNTDSMDFFGIDVALSGDGNTLAVGASRESSDATGVGGNQSNDYSSTRSGAVYVFVRDQNSWSQHAYLKASNTGAEDGFGYVVALSGNGGTLAVGALGEDSDATGINGDETNSNASGSGAVYVFVRDLDTWFQQAYVKASNTDESDGFGLGLALSLDGNTMAVGAFGEDGAATGIGGDDTNDAVPAAGAAYVFVRDQGTWSQHAYVKASNTNGADQFGTSVALSADASTLAVGAPSENYGTTGVGGSPEGVAFDSGAVYLY